MTSSQNNPAAAVKKKAEAAKKREEKKKVQSLDEIEPIHVVGEIFHEVSDQVWIELNLFGFDLSITKLTVFMWIASTILLGLRLV